jgi:hypothetical protein
MPPSGVCSLNGALPSVASMRSISVSVRILMPLAFSASCTKVRHSSSKPRSTRSRRITMSTCAAEPVEDAGELDRDVAAADDGDPLGQRVGQMERLVRRDREIAARIGWHSGRPPVAIRILSA